MQTLSGKVALVTGASSGIGRATACALAKLGVKQLLTARSADRLNQLSVELGPGAQACVADLTRAPEVAKVVAAALERFGRLDIVLANAGIYLSGDIKDQNPDNWDQLIATNVTSVFRLVHATLPHLLAQGSGDVIVTSSISGHQAIHWEPVYSASKHALQSFVHGVRRQLLSTGVRVGAVAPGLVLNELWSITDAAEIERKAAEGAGLRSEDVAEAIVFMLTRPQNVTVRDLVILPRAQDL
jgi:ribitol 2-dehydrogenase